MIVVNNLEWVTTGEACERLAPDVGYETLRNWYAPRHGGTPPVRLLRSPSGHPVRQHRQYLVCWPDVVEVERATRRGGGGRPRAHSESTKTPA